MFYLISLSFSHPCSCLFHLDRVLSLLIVCHNPHNATYSASSVLSLSILISISRAMLTDQRISDNVPTLVTKSSSGCSLGGDIIVECVVLYKSSSQTSFRQNDMYIDRGSITDQYYLHKKTINCHSLSFVVPEQLQKQNKKCLGSSLRSSLSFSLSLSLFFILFSFCALRTVSTCVCFETDNNKVDRWQVQCVATRRHSRARLDFGCSSARIGWTRLMAKLVLVLFKFKFEFEFGFGAARTVGEMCNQPNKIILIKATLCSYAHILTDYCYYNYIYISSSFD